ncbi:GAD-like domain-containing protein [Pseudoduganella sp. S-14]|uniref:GAD-like domain-containing protein n=1 Tax=Pseudoduganella sp. S-14 TaxID=3404065 RepID=UPI003CF6EC5F
MKREYSAFLAASGREVQYAAVPDQILEKYRRILPDSLLEIWQSQGWCSYGGGMFWTVNPEEYGWLVDGWIKPLNGLPKDRYFIIGRSAFGEFFCARENGPRVFTICCPIAAVMARSSALVPGNMEGAIDMFFGGMRLEDFDFDDDDGNPMFEAARDVLGLLGPDEVYGFVPVLPLGGEANVTNLQKLKLGVHIDIVKQLAGVQLMTD